MARYITLNEATVLYNVTTRTIRRRVKRGDIDTDKRGQLLTLNEADLQRLYSKRADTDTDNATDNTDSVTDNVLSVLRQQLDDKQKTIDGLMERNRELNVLLKGEQNKQPVLASADTVTDTDIGGTDPLPESQNNNSNTVAYIVLSLIVAIVIVALYVLEKGIVL